jgi:hypothetical protein
MKPTGLKTPKPIFRVAVNGMSARIAAQCLASSPEVVARTQALLDTFHADPDSKTSRELEAFFGLVGVPDEVRK